MQVRLLSFSTQGNLSGLCRAFVRTPKRVIHGEHVRFWYVTYVQSPPAMIDTHQSSRSIPGPKRPARGCTAPVCSSSHQTKSHTSSRS